MNTPMNIHYNEEIKWDILYLANADQLVVFHAQQWADNRIDAIKQAREELGQAAYFISVTEHMMDMNGNNKVVIEE